MTSHSPRMWFLVAAAGLSLASSSLVMAAPTGTVCPKCGKIHASSGSKVVPASVESAPSTPGSVSQALATGPIRSGVRNVLAALNAQRSRIGVGQLAFDPVLQAVAERRAAEMARTGMKSHPPGSFAPGSYEGVGWSSSYSPSGVSACFTSDSRMRVAGAAMATGRDGVYFAVVYR